MKEQAIRNIIEFYLQKLTDSGLNKRPGKIEPEMSDPDQDKKEEWRTWFPVHSTVTDLEIEELQIKIGHVLPGNYKIFLKHKHFYELCISEAFFFKHPVNTWQSKLIEMIFDNYPTKYLIEKGYIPFAGWSDWGLLCFDTNKNQPDKDYPVVLWDHEVEDEVEERYANFYDLLTRLDEEEKYSEE